MKKMDHHRWNPPLDELQLVGKSMSQDDEPSKCFGFVNRYDTKPKRRLFEMLK